MNTEELRVVDMRGQARARGRIYGETCRDLIASAISTWKQNLGRVSLILRQEPDETRRPRRDDQIAAYLAEFLETGDFIAAIESWAPDLLEEVRGIAEGSGLPFADVLAIQFGDEEWNFAMRRGLDRPVDKCSAFGLAGGPGRIGIAGQNLDTPMWIEGHQVLLRVIPDDGPEALVFTYAGGIAMNGVNAAGIGITCNALAVMNYAGAGVPVAFVVRQILMQTDYAAAVDLLQKLPHASGQNYILSSGDMARCFECCATGVTEVFPDDLGRVTHTNHLLVSTHKDPRFPPTKLFNANSSARLRSLDQRLARPGHHASLDEVRAALSAKDDPDFPVCVPYQPGNPQSVLTAGSTIFEFTVPPKLHVASGPPDVTEFRTFEFSGAV